MGVGLTGSASGMSLVDGVVGPVKAFASDFAVTVRLCAHALQFALPVDCVEGAGGWRRGGHPTHDGRWRSGYGS